VSSWQVVSGPYFAQNRFHPGDGRRAHSKRDLLKESALTEVFGVVHKGPIQPQLKRGTAESHSHWTLPVAKKPQPETFREFSRLLWANGSPETTAVDGPRWFSGAACRMTPAPRTAKPGPKIQLGGLWELASQLLAAVGLSFSACPCLCQVGQFSAACSRF
jgi:hypothetical protein